ncbi:MAG TPA: pyridoxamine 5'-phosphate oxidase family protein [Acidimicrobiales bacterium]
MSIPLAEIARCFEGEIPAALATCSAAGEPNLVLLSRVYLVDHHHVAISNQFFTKTVANLAANPVATLVCADPQTCRSYKLLVRFERSEDEGEVFDTVRESIDMIAALTGMTGVFALRAVGVFRVLDVTAVPRGDTDPES